MQLHRGAAFAVLHADWGQKNWRDMAYYFGFDHNTADHTDII